jgi:Uncharacterised nucleotidyltransferase
MDTSRRGATVAALLEGAWRRLPPSNPSPPVDKAIVALLAAGGVAGLAWYRLRQSPQRNAPIYHEWRQHYRLHSLQAAGWTAAVAEVLARLRGVGIEPILIKGWSSALLYPEPGLRPFGDVDLCVPAGLLAKAVAALSGALPCHVDLHADVPDLPDRTWDMLRSRSQLVSLGGGTVRLLGAEDQLRLLCLHQVRHGIARPLWLCDVAACLEALPDDFDLEYCLSGKVHLSAWTTCVVGLAQRLLGARTTLATAGVPGWLERAVLWCWGLGPGRPWRYFLCHPTEVLRRFYYQGLRQRLGSAPITDAYRLGLGPTASPVLLVQLAAYVRQKVLCLWRRWTIRRTATVPALTIHNS